MVQSLLLNNEESNKLAQTLQHLEDKNGSSIYVTTVKNNSLDCKNWDCFVSCNCANSRD